MENSPPTSSNPENFARMSDEDLVVTLAEAARGVDPERAPNIEDILAFLIDPKTFGVQDPETDVTGEFPPDSGAVERFNVVAGAFLRRAAGRHGLVPDYREVRWDGQ